MEHFHQPQKFAPLLLFLYFLLSNSLINSLLYALLKHIKALENMSSNQLHLRFNKISYCKFSVWFFFVFVFLAMTRGLQDLSSPTGVEPRPPAVESRSPNHWTSGNACKFSVNYIKCTQIFQVDFLLCLQKSQ